MSDTFNATLSPRLEAYRLNKHLLGILNRHAQLMQYAQTAGRDLSKIIRLFREDYNTIDRSVRAQSGDKFSASTVTWGGMPLKASDA